MKKMYIGSAYYVKIENEEQEKKIIALKEKFIADLKELGSSFVSYATSRNSSEDYFSVVDYDVEGKYEKYCFDNFLKISEMENYSGKITTEEAEIKAAEISLQKRKDKAFEDAKRKKAEEIKEIMGDVKFEVGGNEWNLFFVTLQTFWS